MCYCPDFIRQSTRNRHCSRILPSQRAISKFKRRDELRYADTNKRPKFLEETRRIVSRRKSARELPKDNRESLLFVVRIGIFCRIHGFFRLCESKKEETIKCLWKKSTRSGDKWTERQTYSARRGRWETSAWHMPTAPLRSWRQSWRPRRATTRPLPLPGPHWRTRWTPLPRPERHPPPPPPAGAPRPPVAPAAPPSTRAEPKTRRKW